jgi:hypothetical protein
MQQHRVTTLQDSILTRCYRTLRAIPKIIHDVLERLHHLLHFPKKRTENLDLVQM